MAKNALIYLGRGVMLFGLSMMFGLAMFAVSAIENTPARVALSFVLLASCYVVAFIVGRFTGRSDYKMKLVGDLKRKTYGTASAFGTYHPGKEYKWYKGFAAGLCACVIPIVLIVLAQLTQSAGWRLTLFLAGGWSVLPVVSISSSVNLFYGFILCAAFCAASGIGYILGGRKEKLLQYILSRRADSLK